SPLIHAKTLTVINKGDFSENEWEGRQATRLSPKVQGLFLRRADLNAGFNEHGGQITPLSVRITADLSAVDTLLSRAGWKREPDDDSSYLHRLIASGQRSSGS
ncbi:hypothetical protein ACOZB2_26260, partial [Pantoea endophytica]